MELQKKYLPVGTSTLLLFEKPWMYSHKNGVKPRIINIIEESGCGEKDEGVSEKVIPAQKTSH